MAASIQTELRTVQCAGTMCDTCIHGLQGQIKGLEAAYAAAAQGWQDANYRKVGLVIDEAIQALEQPIDKLRVLHEKIKDIEGIFPDLENWNAR